MNSMDLPTGVNTASAVFFFLLEVPALWLGLSALLGLSVGSFLNVVIHRLPLMFKTTSDQPRLNLCFPRSHCPLCGHVIAVRDNIPLIGYVLLRGRCRHCLAPISKRYPLVELLTGCLSLAAAWQWGPTWTCMFAWLAIWTSVAGLFIVWDKYESTRRSESHGCVTKE